MINKLNFNVPVKGLDGKPQVETSLAEALGRLLANEDSNDKYRIYKIRNWCQEIFTKKSISLDEPDIKLLVSMVVASPLAKAFLKAQILDILEGEPKVSAKIARDEGKTPHPKDTPFPPRP